MKDLSSMATLTINNFKLKTRYLTLLTLERQKINGSNQKNDLKKETVQNKGQIIERSKSRGTIENEKGFKQQAKKVQYHVFDKRKVI